MRLDTEQAIGALLEKIVVEQFTAASASASAGDVSKPAIRLIGFEDREIRELVSRMNGWTIPGEPRPVQIVIGASEMPGFENHLLPVGRTLTSYRNSNEHGLVLIEVDPQSDAQGLRQMHSVSDSDLLDPAAGGEIHGRLRWLNDIIWRSAGPDDGTEPPQLFGQTLDQLFAWLTARGRIALRRWVAFVKACALQLAETGQAVDGDKVKWVVSNELRWLGLFPDPLLFKQGASAAGRVERNRNLSELKNPQGRDLADDDLARRIETTHFTDADGNPLSDGQKEGTRAIMRDIRSDGGPSQNHYIDYFYWDQLFGKRSTSEGLGEKIHRFLDENHPTRSSEFVDLQVEDELDEGDEAAAEKLLAAEPPSDEKSLADLLPKTIRKKVDRLVFSGEKSITDPLIAILNGLKALPSDPGSQPETIHLDWERFDDRGEFSARLFWFLYGATLSDVAESSVDSFGSRLQLDDRLASAGGIVGVFDQIRSAAEGNGSDDDDEVDRWAPLQLALRPADSKTPLIRFRWSPEELPGLVFFARLVAGGGSGGLLVGPPIDEWIAGSLHSWSNLTPSGAHPESGVTARWAELASHHMSEFALQGISATGIDTYLTAWTDLLLEARDALVPAGGRMDELDRFTSYETADTPDGHSIMLGTHPIRLRWMSHHLRHMSEFVRRALEGELNLNAENDQLYFDWLDKVSPHRQPPVMTKRNELLTPIREIGLHEEFAPVSTEPTDVPEWLGGVDNASVEEIVSTVTSFVAAFPHKTTGLSVLLLLHSGAPRVARRFVERLRRRDLSKLDLELHIVTRASDHDSVAAALAGFDSDEGRGTTLLPSFRLVLHDWRDDPAKSLDGLQGRVDVAVAPNLFGLHSTPFPETRRRESGLGGSYDPWIDRTSYSRPPAVGTTNVSQVLLPVSPDPIFEAWSTLAVRRHNQQPMNADEPENTDFFTLQIQFDQNEHLFAALHDTAHWVVTLDPYIGRDQIDALSEGPDVITVKPGVGKNQSYNLVVSSTAGKRWVTSRLRSRLSDDFDVDPAVAHAVAERLYEIGRQVVPGLMLRAVGLGRTIEEILGLIFARYQIDATMPPDAAASGVEYWVSLDEHKEWFGGANRMRPDLLRLRAFVEDDGVHLDLLVVESKFRQQFDLGAADEQVDRAMALFGDAFGGGSSEFDDVRFWRRELLSAIEELPRNVPGPADLTAVREFGAQIDERDVLDAIRNGAYDLRSIDAVVSLTAWASDIAVTHPTTTPGGHRLLTIDRRRAREITEELVGSTGVLAVTESVDTTRDEAPSGPIEIEEDGVEAVSEFPESMEATEATTPPAEIAQRAAPALLDGAEPTVPSVSAEPLMPLPAEDAAPVPTEVTGPAVEPTFADRHGLADEPDGVTRVPVTAGDVAHDRTADRLPAAVLESRLQKILDRLGQLGVSANRPDGIAYQEGPGFCSFRVIPGPGVSATNVTGKIEDLKLALELPADVSVRSFVDRGAVVFEIPKEDDERYFVDAETLLASVADDPGALSVPFGEDANGAPVSIDFSSSDTPHLLIAGQTGSGKSVALETILLGLCARKSPEELRLLLVDGKGTELTDFEESPHLQGQIGWMPEDAIEILTRSVDEMNRRYQAFKAHRSKSLQQYNAAVEEADRLPWWLVVLDEYADLTSDADDRKKIESNLKRVAQKGRAAGIHLIVATQKPSAEVLSTVIRSNLPAQLALRVKSAMDSRIILDENGAESLAGKGDAFFRTAKGMTRVQCASR